MEIARSKKGISVFQRKYVLDLLNETDMLESRPSDTPIEGGKKAEDNGKPFEKDNYQRLIERLISLSHTRRNVAFAVSMISNICIRQKKFI